MKRGKKIFFSVLFDLITERLKIKSFLYRSRHHGNSAGAFN